MDESWTNGLTCQLGQSLDQDPVVRSDCSEQGREAVLVLWRSFADRLHNQRRAVLVMGRSARVFCKHWH